MKNPITKPSFSFRQMLIFIVSMMILPAAFAQGVSINNSNTPPDPSAMLDVESTTRGFLPPRLTAAQRTAVQNPASGLVVFDTDFNALFVMTGEGWMQVDAGEKWLKDEDNNLTYSSGNVGIGVPYPSALLHTSGAGTGEGNVLFMGEWKGAPGLAPASGPGTRMMWYPDKAAFRAGRVTGTQWDSENIGFYSTAFGFNSSASGWFSNAWGSVTAASGSQSTAWGFNSIASGTSATAWGENTRAPSFAETAFGYNNTSYIPVSATEWVASDRLFVIGNGISGSSDALVMLKNGNMGLGTSNPTQRLEVAGSIFAQSSNWAIRGVKTGTTGTFPGVWGETESASSGATGVRGFALSTTTSGGSSGVYGRNFALNNFGYGVRGTHDSGGWGVYGETVSGRGVYGFASATTGVNFGVYGQTNSPTGIAVHGVNSAVYVPGTNARAAVFEVSSVHGIAVKGVALSTGNVSTGVIGEVFSTSGVGVKGDASETNFGYGIWGVSGATGQYAGYFTGQVYITQTLSVNGPSAFVIDHPYDPANKYLSHFSIKSPEPYNLYRGTIILDEGGSAWVRLPDYFDAINIDFSYQLTAVGAPMPDLHIVSTISDGKFQIGGGAPGKQVCWEVTALRNDAYVRDKGYQTEKAKPEYERGTYIYPQGHGQPKELQRDYQRLQQTKGSEANGINQL